jgi:hypothetical protein
MCAMLELTMEDFEGRRIWERLGKREARSKNLPLSVSLLCLSTALCVARRSAVLARRLGLRFIAADPLPGPAEGAAGVAEADEEEPSLLLSVLFVKFELLEELLLLLLLLAAAALLEPVVVGDAGCASEAGESGSVMAISSSGSGYKSSGIDERVVKSGGTGAWKCGSAVMRKGEGEKRRGEVVEVVWFTVRC